MHFYSCGNENLKHVKEIIEICQDKSIFEVEEMLNSFSKVKINENY